MKSFFFVAEVSATNPGSMKLHVQPTADRSAAMEAYQDMAHGKGQKKVAKGATLAVGTLDFLRTHRASSATPQPVAIETAPVAKA